MPEKTSSASEMRRTGGRFVGGGIAAVVAIILIGAGLLLWALPDANAFNAQVERIFVENDDLTYRIVIIVLLVFATAMLVAALVFLIMLVGFNRRMAQIERVGIQVNSLLISREENTVYLNNLGFKLTAAAMETMSVLAEARMDDDVLSGSEIEGVISGRTAADCDEAAGATRIKRLRDTLGNQIVSELLVKNIARRGYMLAIDKDVIKVI